MKIELDRVKGIGVAPADALTLVIPFAAPYIVLRGPETPSPAPKIPAVRATAL